MKNFKNRFLIPVVVLLAMASCRKFEEDPFVSFHSVGRRLQGNWKIESYKINGIEHSHDFDSLLTPLTLTDLKLVIGNDDSRMTSGPFYFADPNGNGYIPFGYASYHNYKVIDNNKSIRFIFYHIKIYDLFFLDYYHNLPIDSGAHSDWSIYKLYKNEFHIKRNETDIFFKK